jgi:hypothetical protein
MFERYYREGITGERLPVTEDQWAVDRYHSSYQQVIAQPGLTIYKVKGN